MLLFGSQLEQLAAVTLRDLSLKMRQLLIGFNMTPSSSIKKLFPHFDMEELDSICKLQVNSHYYICSSVHILLVM